MHFYFRHYLIFILLAILYMQNAYSVTKINKEKKKTFILRTPQPDPFINIKTDTKLAQSPTVNHNPKKFANSFKDGIDISHYQGAINWQTIANGNSISFAYVKATESNYFIDDYYYYNFEEGQKQGIAMGSYHFFRANVSMLEQFEHMTSVIDPTKQDIVPMIDVEAANGVPTDVFANRLKEFLKMVESFYKRPPILYTYVNFYNKYIANKGFEKYPLMIAFYNGTTPSVVDGRKYIMWQYTCRGRISGIKGDVDKSRFTNGASLYDILYQ